MPQSQAAVADVEVDLGGGVGVGGGAAGALERGVEGAVPVLGIAHGVGVAGEQGLGELPALVGALGLLVEVEDVVGRLGGAGGLQGGLHLEDVAEGPEHRPDQLFLGLGLFGAGGVGGVESGDMRSRGGELLAGDQLVPLGPAGQRLVQVVVGEQRLVAVRRPAQRGLGGRARHRRVPHTTSRPGHARARVVRVDGWSGTHAAYYARGRRRIPRADSGPPIPASLPDRFGYQLSYGNSTRHAIPSRGTVTGLRPITVCWRSAHESSRDP